ncbi:MAG: pseudouridine synthase [Thermodesulfobacteriota bacterium]
MIAAAGISSRRKAEELITGGRVKVNGAVVVKLGTRVDPRADVIEVDGKKIYRDAGPRVYLLLNKPRGVISSAYDPLGRPVVTDIVKGYKKRLFPVGRLDWDAEGALVLTNDGELTNRLIHPGFSVPKKYLVKVKGLPSEKELKKIEKGVFLSDGKTLPARVRFIKETRENSWIEIVVTEGRNRLIKRLLLAVGHPVLKLKRTEFAGLKVGKLKTGSFRALREREVERLKKRWS